MDIKARTLSGGLAFVGVAAAVPFTANSILGLVVLPWVALREGSLELTYALIGGAQTQATVLAFALSTLVWLASLAVLGLRMNRASRWRLDAPGSGWRTLKLAVFAYVVSYLLSTIAPAVLTIPLDRVSLSFEDSRQQVGVLMTPFWWAFIVMLGIGAVAMVLDAVMASREDREFARSARKA